MFQKQTDENGNRQETTQYLKKVVTLAYIKQKTKKIKRRCHRTKSATGGVLQKKVYQSLTKPYFQNKNFYVNLQWLFSVIFYFSPQYFPVVFPGITNSS